MLCMDPKKRITAKSALEHEYFKIDESVDVKLPKKIRAMNRKRRLDWYATYVYSGVGYITHVTHGLYLLLLPPSSGCTAA